MFNFFVKPKFIKLIFKTKMLLDAPTESGKPFHIWITLVRNYILKKVQAVYLILYKTDIKPQRSRNIAVGI